MDAEERADWIAYLAEANDEAANSKAMLNQRVIEARESEVSWNTIAEAIGITRQAATERFGKVVEGVGS